MLDNLPDGSTCSTKKCRCKVKAEAAKEYRIAIRLAKNRKTVILRNTKVICMDNAKKTPKTKRELALSLLRCERITMRDLRLAKYSKLLSLKPKKFTGKVASTMCINQKFSGCK